MREGLKEKTISWTPALQNVPSLFDRDVFYALKHADPKPLREYHNGPGNKGHNNDVAHDIGRPVQSFHTFLENVDLFGREPIGPEAKYLFLREAEKTFPVVGFQELLYGLYVFVSKVLHI